MAAPPLNPFSLLYDDMISEFLSHVDPPSALMFGWTARESWRAIHKIAPLLRERALALERLAYPTSFRYHTDEPCDDPFLYKSAAYIRFLARSGHINLLEEVREEWAYDVEAVAEAAASSAQTALCLHLAKINPKFESTMLLIAQKEHHFWTYFRLAVLDLDVDLPPFSPDEDPIAKDGSSN